MENVLNVLSLLGIHALLFVLPCSRDMYSIALYYISLLSGLGNIDDQNRNPTKNNREHLVGRPTSCTFAQTRTAPEA